MITAILSDIHANLEALEAVLSVLAERRPARILCLGDVVGYGANPNECATLVRERCEIVLLGNHDAAATGGPEAARFNVHARTAAQWTAKVLTAAHRDWLRALPLAHSYGTFTCVHASPASPRAWEYIFDRYDAEPQFQYFTERVCFIGHTHQPAAYELRDSGCFPVTSPRLRLQPDRRYIVNVGSVGQPRDRDPRASLVFLHEGAGEIEFLRVPYDIEGAQRKILGAELPPFLAARLATGE
ncbi:MAG TPA: metallophosphoesterase family protein [Candidatus Eisenbacteria bacterium]|jgi:diadenosine tetraphosphatase ApaH/serine/threonine PP2A family protein phosphatase